MRLNRTLFILILFTVVLAYSCSSVKVTTKASVPVTDELGREEITKTIWTYFGQEKTWDIQTCNEGALSIVQVRPNLIYSIVEVITLGALRPTKLVCSCNEDPQ